MFNATTSTTANLAAAPSSLFWIIEALLMVQLRDELVAEHPAAQVDGAYHYGL